jgi:hypothetical protein
VAGNSKKTEGRNPSPAAPERSARKAPVTRIEKIAGLLSDLADLMRQEDLGKESLHHLRQLQMRVRFARATSKPTAIERNMPEVPPALYAQRVDRNETPVAFLLREWGPFIGHGLTRAHLRADMGLYNALNHWLKTNELPPGLDLPSKQSMIDRKLAESKSLTIVHSPEQRERLRLQQAARRRAQKKPEGQ